MRRTELKRTPMNRQPKPRKCAVCRETFQPFQVGQKVCCPVPCGVTHARQERERKAKRERAERKRKTRAELEAMKPPGQRLREATQRAQRAFNAMIRERDRDKPCICCGKWTDDKNLLTGSRWDAGHWLSVGAHPELRFDEDNCHRQMVRCNRELSGNAGKYRERLIERIGIKRVERLEGPHEPKRYTVEELDKMAAEFRRRTRELQRER